MKIYKEICSLAMLDLYTGINLIRGLQDALIRTNCNCVFCFILSDETLHFYISITVTLSREHCVIFF